MQQADVIAVAIAARLGAHVRPTTFRPILRGLLLTGEMPRFLQARIGGGQGETSVVSVSPLWWPPSKIAGRLASALREAGPHPTGGEALRARARRTPESRAALVASLVATGLALFALGLVKGRVAAMALRSGLQVLLVGGGSAAIGYLIGVLVPKLF